MVMMLLQFLRIQLQWVERVFNMIGGGVGIPYMLTFTISRGIYSSIG